MKIEFNGVQLELLKDRAIWWEEKKCLFLSDVHLGKTQHFRKNGIALPSGAELLDENNLFDLLTKYPAQELYILGDLFHSDMNKEWGILSKFRARFTETKMFLVIGNHDVLQGEAYAEAGYEILGEKFSLGPFQLIHDPADIDTNESYLCGHLHPGYLIKGKARQSLRLPAFYHYKNTLYLPAFGSLTGLFIPRFSKEAQAYIITPQGVVQAGRK